MRHTVQKSRVATLDYQTPYCSKIQDLPGIFEHLPWMQTLPWMIIEFLHQLLHITGHVIYHICKKNFLYY
ncbi:hypothetical protein RhiirB3_9362 [Rhizophagus irregularis]|nr:hypothetical protein RhiirB3_9362 [Rhizophagus irregularis]